MSVEKYIKKVGFWDCDWSSIYARGPIQEFEKDCKEHPEIIDYFFEYYTTWNDRIKTSMFNLIHFSNQIEQVKSQLPTIKRVLEQEQDNEVIDACLRMLECVNMVYSVDISFLNSMTFRADWLTEYAHSIAQD